MTLRIIRWAAFIGLALGSTGCLFLYDDPWGTGEPTAVREFHRTVPLEAKSSLKVFNLDGDIEIRGGDRSDAEIIAESEPGRRWIWPLGNRSGRPRIDWAFADGELTIRTLWQGDDRAVYPVHLFLNVPHSIDLRDIRTGRGNIVIADLYGQAAVQVQRGDLKVENFSGSLRAQVWRGEIQAEVLDPRAGDTIDLAARAGDITLILENGAAFKLDAEARDGVTSDFDLRKPLPANRISAVLGVSGAAIILKAPNGRIALHKVQ